MARADGKDDRRGALRKLIMLGGAALAGGVGVPAGRLVLGPALDSSPPTERWFRVARLAEIVHGEPKRVAVTTDATDAWMHYQRESLGAVWLLRDQDEVRALSVSCPHLGCGIERVERGFACACHASISTPRASTHPDRRRATWIPLMRAWWATGPTGQSR